jgi:hypothetical protein
MGEIAQLRNGLRQRLRNQMNRHSRSPTSLETIIRFG